MGELVAEIAACFVGSELAVPQSTDLSNHAAYLAHWLREIEADPAALTRAAAQASQVCDFILGFGRPAGVRAGVTASVA